MSVTDAKLLKLCRESDLTFDQLERLHKQGLLTDRGLSMSLVVVVTVLPNGLEVRNVREDGAFCKSGNVIIGFPNGGPELEVKRYSLANALDAVSMGDSERNDGYDDE